MDTIHKMLTECYSDNRGDGAAVPPDALELKASNPQRDLIVCYCIASRYVPSDTSDSMQLTTIELIPPSKKRSLISAS